MGEKTVFSVDSDDNRIKLNEEEEQTLTDIFDGRQAAKSIRNLLQKVALITIALAAAIVGHGGIKSEAISGSL